ncbi:MAG: hypothetical protein ABFS34_08035 [Gemmatimonadota bacterium]
MRSPAFALAAYTALLAAPSPGSAQEITSPYRFVDEKQTIQALFGYVAADEGTVSLASESANIFGLRYAYRLAGPFSAVAEAAFFPSTRAVLDLSEDEEPVREVVGDADFDLAFLHAGLRMDLTGARSFHGLMPYFAVLGGGAFDVSDETPVEEDVPTENRLDFGTSFSGVFAIGTDYLVGSRLALGVEVRQALWKVETPEPFILADFGLPQEEWVGNLTFLAGASLRF